MPKLNVLLFSVLVVLTTQLRSQDSLNTVFSCDTTRDAFELKLYQKMQQIVDSGAKKVLFLYEAARPEDGGPVHFLYWEDKNRRSKNSLYFSIDNSWKKPDYKRKDNIFKHKLYLDSLQYSCKKLAQLPGDTTYSTYSQDHVFRLYFYLNAQYTQWQFCEAVWIPSEDDRRYPHLNTLIPYLRDKTDELTDKLRLKMPHIRSL